MHLRMKESTYVYSKSFFLFFSLFFFVSKVTEIIAFCFEKKSKVPQAKVIVPSSTFFQLCSLGHFLMSWLKRLSFRSKFQVLIPKSSLRFVLFLKARNFSNVCRYLGILTMLNDRWFLPTWFFLMPGSITFKSILKLHMRSCKDAVGYYWEMSIIFTNER